MVRMHWVRGPHPRRATSATWPRPATRRHCWRLARTWRALRRTATARGVRPRRPAARQRPGRHFAASCGWSTSTGRGWRRCGGEPAPPGDRPPQLPAHRRDWGRWMDTFPGLVIYTALLRPVPAIRTPWRQLQRRREHPVLPPTTSSNRAGPRAGTCLLASAMPRWVTWPSGSRTPATQGGRPADPSRPCSTARRSARCRRGRPGPLTWDQASSSPRNGRRTNRTRRATGPAPYAGMAGNDPSRPGSSPWSQPGEADDHTTVRAAAGHPTPGGAEAVGRDRIVARRAVRASVCVLALVIAVASGSPAVLASGHPGRARRDRNRVRDAAPARVGQAEQAGACTTNGAGHRHGRAVSGPVRGSGFGAATYR